MTTEPKIKVDSLGDHLQSTVFNLISHLKGQGTKVEDNDVKDFVKEIKSAISPSNLSLKDLSADTLVEQARGLSEGIGTESYNKNTLGRVLEIPPEEVEQIKYKSDIDSKQAAHHAKLEYFFAKWLQEWGYSVEIGKIFSPHYIADVYGELISLEGYNFEVFLNFITDSPPPNEYRFLALLVRIKEYEDWVSSEIKQSHRSKKDIFIIATPYSFTDELKKSINSVCSRNIVDENIKEDIEETYSIAALNGVSIHALEQAADRIERKELLMEFLKQTIV